MKIKTVHWPRPGMTELIAFDECGMVFMNLDVSAPDPVEDMSWKEARPVGREETMREVMERQYREKKAREALEAKAKPRQVSQQEREEAHYRMVERIHRESMEEFDSQSAEQRKAEREQEIECLSCGSKMGSRRIGTLEVITLKPDYSEGFEGRFRRMMIRDIERMYGLSAALAALDDAGGDQPKVEWIPVHQRLIDEARRIQEKPKGPPVWRGLDLGKSHGKGQSIRAAFGRRK